MRPSPGRCAILPVGGAARNRIGGCTTCGHAASPTVIAREERYLDGRFGEKYRQQNARVRHWI